MSRYLIAVALALALSVAPDASAQTVTQGSVGGTTTVNNHFSGAVQGATMNITIDARGFGNNKLKVKVQWKRSGGSWHQIERFFVSPGSVSTGQYTVPDLEGVIVRLRVSRKIGTRRINYTITESAQP